ncbi:MAG: DUF7224 domain-containing protein, partial [Angustibacter sp.]
STLIGQTWDPVFATLMLVVLGAGGFGLGLLALVKVGQGLRGRKIVSVFLMLVATVAGVMLENSGRTRIMVTAGPVAMRCAGQIVRTCLPTNDSTRLPELARLIDANSRALIAIGVTPPTNFAIDIPGRKPPKDTAVISLASGDLRRLASDPGITADFLSTPTPCSAYTNPNVTLKELPDAVFQSRIVIGAWLRKQTELQQVDVGLDPEDLNKWLGSAESSQNAWVRETYAQLKNCELTKVSMPFEVGVF